MKEIATFLSPMRKTDINEAGAWETPRPNESPGKLMHLKTAVRTRDRAQQALNRTILATGSE